MTKYTRRNFLNTTIGGMTALAVLPRNVIAGAKEPPPSDLVNIAVIGAGGQGFFNAKQFAKIPTAQMVAVADPITWTDYSKCYYKGVGGREPVAKYITEVNEKRGKKNLKCTTHVNYRKMLDKNGKDFDAVIVSTPDHVHSVATLDAIDLGKHVYCEKPAAQNVADVRRMTNAAREKKVATQLGTRCHASPNFRRVIEMVRAGSLGQVNEVLIWRSLGGHPGPRPTGTPPVPDGIDWDLWLGPAPYRPYHPCYHPMSWRGWWDFGNSQLGDMGCHLLDLPFWTFDLKYPKTVAAEGDPVVAPKERGARGLKVTWEFDLPDQKEPLKVVWMDGNKIPDKLKGEKMPDWPIGILTVGEKGMIACEYGKKVLFPKEGELKVPPQTIPNSPGHFLEWILGCKGEGKPLCNLDYSGPLSEAVLLGTAAYRTGKKLEWDSENLKATNAPEADQFLRRKNRKGWEV